MYRAGHIIRRSSIRIKSLSGGHSDLLMIISQIKEVRATFKAFIAAQAILSEDMYKWSCSIDNEAIHQTYGYLADLSSLWQEVQRDFVDNLKHFRSNFDMILEGDKHVDLAKQIYVSKEEAERDVRKDLHKAHKKSPTDEIHILREKLNASEKAKELAHIEVIDRVRENEAIRVIRVKEGMKKYGESFIEMIHKASIIFNAQQKVVNEIPDVHDKALHNMKYKGDVCCADFVQEAKDQTRTYRRPVGLPQEGESDNKNPFYDPPPPYTPPASNSSVNDLSNSLSGATLTNTSEASASATEDRNYRIFPKSLSFNGTPTCPTTSYGFYPRIDHRDVAPSSEVHNSSVTNRVGNAHNSSVRDRIDNSSEELVPNETERRSSTGQPKLSHSRTMPQIYPPLFPLKASRRRKKKPQQKTEIQSPSTQNSNSYEAAGGTNSSVTIPNERIINEVPCPMTDPITGISSDRRHLSPVIHNISPACVDNSLPVEAQAMSIVSPPPYNPYYEWSSFPND